MTVQGRGNDGALDRVLNAPTNEAWIDPWVRHLRALGRAVLRRPDRRGARRRGGRIVAARVRDRRGRRRRVEADWFVCAMPAERARRLWSADVLALDPQLEAMNELEVDWMNGIQFFLRRRIDAHARPRVVRGLAVGAHRVDPGAVLDAPRLPRDLRRRRRGRLPVDRHLRLGHARHPLRQAGEALHRLAGQERGVGTGQGPPGGRRRADPARRASCTRGSWTRRSSWIPARRRNRNDEPLLVNTIGSWDHRPAAGTAIPQPVSSPGDYVQTDIDLATMEGANESAREATNEILRRSGSTGRAGAEVQALRPAGVRGGQARRRRAIPGRPPERAR